MRSIKETFYDLTSLIVDKTNELFNKERQAATKDGKEFNCSKQEHEMIGEIKGLVNTPSFEVKTSDKKVKHSLYLKTETVNRLAKIDDFLQDNYFSTVRDGKLKSSESLDFVINTFYTLIISYRVYIHGHPEQKDQLSFDKWLASEAMTPDDVNVPVTQGEDSGTENNTQIVDSTNSLRRETQALSHQADKIYYLLLNNYVRDHGYIEKDEFLKQGTTVDSFSKIGSLDIELRKVVKKESDDRKEREQNREGNQQ